jgi:hypothetical protein
MVMLGFIAVRRLAGAMQFPASAGVCLVTGIALAAFACWFRKRLMKRLGLWPAFALVGALSVVGAASVSIAGTQATSLLALWLPIAGEAALAFGRESAADPLAVVAAPDELPASRPGIERDSPLADTTLADPAMLQQFVRRRDETGVESISGYLRANFAPAERTINLHVPFCPPLEVVPGCEAEAIDGPPARVKVAQVLPQGARLEVRLDEAAASPQQVVIEFTTI